MIQNTAPDREEPLDFCRVKKIDEKGYGFLKSMYYPRDIFFHFNQIKNEEVKETFEKLKRGEFLIYFTSKLLPDGKRKAVRFWYRFSDTPNELRNTFAERIFFDFESGKMNLFDLLYAYREMKESGMITLMHTERMLRSARLKNVPTTVISYLAPEEYSLLKRTTGLEGYRESEVKPFWFDEIDAL